MASSSTEPVDSWPVADSLDPAVEDAFERARHTAIAQGVQLDLVSGWRSVAEQEALYADAVTAYGSEQEARRWVLPPEHSAHVAGVAIDVGPAEGARWLERYGAQFGLCRTYANEPWHFELLIEPGGTCPPPMYEDASWGWS